MKSIILLLSLLYGLSSFSCEKGAPCIYINTENEEFFEASQPYENNETNYIEDEEKLSQYLMSLAGEFYGVPYIFGGETKSGIDCSAFTQKVFSKLGVNLARTSRQQHTDSRFLDVESIMPFDLLFFKKSKYSKVTHVAIYLGKGKMIHSSKNEGGVYISEFKRSGIWQRLFYKARRLKELNKEEIYEKVISNNI
jgi:cell wall-associated NlpC family hydrolase